MSCEKEKKAHDESSKSVKELAERMEEARKRVRPVWNRWITTCVEGVPPGAPDPPGCDAIEEELDPLLDKFGKAEKALHEALMKDVQNLNAYTECVKDVHKNKGVS